MSHVSTTDQITELASKSSTTTDLSFRRVFEPFEAAVRFESIFLTTFLPRGGLQIIQPAKSDEPLLKAYQATGHLLDEGMWDAASTGRPQTMASDSRFVREFLHPLGFEHDVVVALPSPLFDGFPGAIHLLRKPDSEPFSRLDTQALVSTASQWQRLALRRRETRQHNDQRWVDGKAFRFFGFNSVGKPLFNADGFEALDDELHANMLSAVRHAVTNVPDTFEVSRVQLANTAGDLSNFNLAIYPDYPALGGGVVVFVCRIPNCPQWGTLRPTDLLADPEYARLVPATKFMRTEFQRNPSLGEIAASVHLSPFHFHRRFTELMGLTPKHFMLDCQIYDAKTMLLNGDELTTIASACGFAHQSHFTSRFKQATGLTPTRWRRTMRSHLNLHPNARPLET